MYSLTTVLWAALAAAMASGAVVWLVMIVGQMRAEVASQRRELDELRQQQAKPLPAAMREWAENVKLDHRAQLLSAATLVKMAARDNLDALWRMSPEMALEAIREIAPQLLSKENLK